MKKAKKKKMCFIQYHEHMINNCSETSIRKHQQKKRPSIQNHFPQFYSLSGKESSSRFISKQTKQINFSQLGETWNKNTNHA